MAFKDTYKLQGVANWCFTKPDLIKRGLRAKYKKNAPVTVAKNKSDPRNVNVFVDGLIVGFVDHPNTIEIISAIDKKENIRGRISDVTTGGIKGQPPERVTVELSSYKAGYKKNNTGGNQNIFGAKAKSSHATEESESIKQSSDIGPKHCILDKPFSRQPKKKVPVREHWARWASTASGAIHTIHTLVSRKTSVKESGSTIVN